MVAPMADALVINSTPSQVRVALMQAGKPVEVYVEPRAERGVVGNIYRGRVVRVLPGMQAAFVDIGLARTAFLYVDDAVPKVAEEVAQKADPPPPSHVTGPRGFRAAPTARIEAVVKPGQDIVVQVQKEPMGHKGARVTCQISLPGRFVVFMPNAPHVGVSHRIAGAEDRLRLKTLLQPLAPAHGGFVARTAALQVDSATLADEARRLVAAWEGIVSQSETRGGGRLLYTELDLVMRAARELVDDNVTRVVIDAADDCARLRDFVGTFARTPGTQVELHSGPQGLFAHYGVEDAIAAALKRRVGLDSGGYLIFDQAEALTVIDVNSGRFVGKRNLEETMTALNLEAAAQVAYQLRLRNIGGIIIIDFIDMVHAHSRQAVLEALATALQQDKAKTTLVSMSEIGLVQMTRKRVRESLGHVLQEPCTYCNGQGTIKRAATVAHEALREVGQMLQQSHASQVTLRAEPAVAQHLTGASADELRQLETAYGSRITCVAQPNLHRENFELLGGSALP
jgi:ribonuclease G